MLPMRSIWWLNETGDQWRVGPHPVCVVDPRGDNGRPGEDVESECERNSRDAARVEMSHLPGRHWVHSGT